MSTRPISCVVAVISILVFSQNALSQTTWLGTSDFNWNNSSNWDPQSVPAAGDSVILSESDWNDINVASDVTVGSIFFEDSYRLAGLGSIRVEGRASRIDAGRFGPFYSSGSQIDVPILLANDVLVTTSISSSFTFSSDIDVNGHELSISGKNWLRDATIRGDGVVSVVNGTLRGQGTIEPTLRTNGGIVEPNGQLTVLGDAEIKATLHIDSATSFDAINGGGQGTLHVDKLLINLASFPNIVDLEFNIFPGWDAITVDEVELPGGSIHWDLTGISEGVLRLSVDDPFACDFDLSGRCDLTDLDFLGDKISSVGNDQSVDMNGDGQVNLDDRDEWLFIAGRFPLGDANLDGRVDAGDLMAIGSNWQLNGATSYAQGDFNFDGMVDSTDLNALGRNWQLGADRANAVPEPTGYLLMGIGFVFIARLLRKQNGRTVCLLFAAMVTTLIHRL